jgi:hypothetical protein
MRRRWLVTGAFDVITSMALAPLAAADELVQFETTSTGTRLLTAAVAPVFTPTTDLNVTQTISTTVPASATVTEVFAQGSNPWSVKAQMCGPNSYASPTAGDCVNKAARMERADGDTILGSTIAVTHGGPTVVLGGGTTTVGSEATLADQITLLNNTGQNPLTTYNGTYTGTASLSIANFSRVGVWKGMWVVTETL